MSSSPKSRRPARQSNYSLAESLEARCLLSATVPAGFVEIGSASVLAIDQSPTEIRSASGGTITYQSGETYFFLATGTCQVAAGPRYADAGYAQHVVEGDFIENYHGLKLEVGGTSNSGFAPNSGAWRDGTATTDDHILGKTVTGLSGTAEALYHDIGGEYYDNSGSSSVTLYARVMAHSVTGTIGGQSQRRDDDGLVITNANVVAVPTSGGQMALTLNGLYPNLPDQSGPPHVPATADEILWTVVRNSSDVATGILPSVTESTSNPLKASLAMNGVGSFNVIAYFDANGNGHYDAGEQLQVFHVAEVGATIGEGAITTSRNNYAVHVGEDATGISSGDIDGHPAISSNETVTLLGGGPAGTIGLDKIHLGWLQNGVADSFVATYADGHTESEVVSPQHFPLLDSAREPHGVGGLSAFLTSSKESNGTPNVGGGVNFIVTSMDSPGVGFPSNFPVTNSLPASTDGTNNFKNYLVAYSDGYDQWYSPYLQVSWYARFKYSRRAGVWTNNGSTTSARVIGIPNPTTLSQLRIMAVGATYSGSAHDVEG